MRSAIADAIIAMMNCTVVGSMVGVQNRGFRLAFQAYESAQNHETITAISFWTARDVTLAADVEALGAHVGKQPVDLLVNNAGVSSPFSTLSDLNEATLAQAMDVFNVNALGPLRVTRALSENLVVAKGRLVNITSLMGSMEDNGSGRAYAYRMSKAALNMATTNMALELGPAGVTVVAINPGWVRTDLGSERAPTPVDECGAALEALFDGLTPTRNGQFLNWDGRRLPW